MAPKRMAPKRMAPKRMRDAPSNIQQPPSGPSPSQIGNNAAHAGFDGLRLDGYLERRVERRTSPLSCGE
jgi:hypothetical protein